MTYRGALIGCGFFARNHMHGWADTIGAEIIAVCDTDQARAAAFATDFGAQPFTDAETMLAALRPDFVDIATTVPSHRPLVELALGHGALTICQKPFAETYRDGAAMVAAAEKSRRPLLVHENFRWQKPLRALQAELARGAIGQPSFARVSFRHGYDIYTNQPYLAQTPDLALMDIGLHLFDLARFLLGDVARLTCETQRLNPKVKGEDAFTALLRHTSGAVSTVECSFFAQITPDPFPQTLVRIEGDSGTLELDAQYKLRLHKDGALRETDVEPDVPAWGAKPWHAIQDSVAAFQSHVVDVLRGAAGPQPSGAHNLGTLALTLAAYHSAARGTAVDIPQFIAQGCPR